MTTTSQSIFTEMKFTETIDKKLLESLLCNKDLLTTWTDQQGIERSDEKQLVNILHSIKGNKLTVNYKHADGFKNWGRVYPEGFTSLGCCQRNIRGTLTAGTYIDIDLVNCHPVMILTLLKKNNYQCQNYQNYCNNRDTELNTIKTAFNCTRDVAKKFFIIAGYGGSYNKWINDNELESNDNAFKNKFMSFQNESRNLAQRFIIENNDKYQAYIKRKNKTFNKEFSFLSAMLQDEECNILETIYTVFNDNGLIKHNNAILCHDGIMLNRKSIKQEDLTNVENKIYDMFQYKFTIVSKPLNNYLDKIQDEKIVDDGKPFDGQYFDKIQSYENKKMYFERYFCKITNSTEFVKLNIFQDYGLQKYSHTIFSESNLIASFKQYPEHRIFEDTEDKKKAPKPFITKWLSDAEMRVYERKGWSPYNGTYQQTDKSLFNMFVGYSTVINKPLPDNSYDLIKPLLDVMLNLCEGEQKNLDFLIHYLAHTIQKPADILPFAIIFTGKQGTGKDTLINAMSKIVGADFVNSESKIENFLGTHAEGLVEKILVAFNESEASKSFNYEGIVKTIITDSELTVNKKYQLPYKVKNCARKLFFSNKSNPIKFDSVSTDRRFLAFKTTDKYAHKQYSRFWGQFYKIMNRAEFATSFYHYLNKIDLTGYDFAKERLKVLTETYRDMVRKQLPPVVDFFSEYINKCNLIDEPEAFNELTKIPEAELWKAYQRWQRKNRPDSAKDTGYIGTKRNFKSSFKTLQLPVNFYRNGPECMVRFTPADCYDTMKRSGWIENEFFDEESEDCMEYNLDDLF